MIKQWAVAVACGLGGLACGGTKPAEVPSGATELGRSPEAPVVTCGPQESYAYVATRFRCADGGNPFGGDAERARTARRGSTGSPSSNHVLDIYDVPCKTGTVALYVDMYGCDEYASKLAEAQQGSSQAEELINGFHAGEFDAVLARCRELPKGSPIDVMAWCRALVPAALYAQKHDTEALGALSASCQTLHPATPESDARATQLAMTIVALASLAQKGKYESDEEQRSAMLKTWLEACEVPPGELQRVIQEMQNEE